MAKLVVPWMIAALLICSVVFMDVKVAEAKEISYGAIGKNGIPCKVGSSQANCKKEPPSNNHTRGCNKATRCRSGSPPPPAKKDKRTPPPAKKDKRTPHDSQTNV
ncbi:hypothetical protein NE237_001730 [Protea cynaroides]|uniref:Rapid ALkalinization Factor n=1 Tax=Protea cynaroides TaxID=273540 RepID=A0A9Q0KU34_9MAGN|nr:hypothetical protein NE237_001730 [Protea cynaroides]